MLLASNKIKLWDFYSSSVGPQYRISFSCAFCINQTQMYNDTSIYQCVDKIHRFVFFSSSSFEWIYDHIIVSSFFKFLLWILNFNDNVGSIRVVIVCLSKSVNIEWLRFIGVKFALLIKKKQKTKINSNYFRIKCYFNGWRFNDDRNIRLAFVL